MKKNNLQSLSRQFAEHEIRDKESFNSLNQSIRNFHDSLKVDLIEIKLETKKTNGRINKLENLKYIMIGALAVITAIVVPLLLNILSK